MCAPHYNPHGGETMRAMLRWDAGRGLKAWALDQTASNKAPPLSHPQQEHRYPGSPTLLRPFVCRERFGRIIVGVELLHHRMEYRTAPHAVGH